MFDFLIQADRWLLLLINGCHSPTLDTIMLYISGTWMWVPVYAIVAYLWISKLGYQAWSVILFTLILLGFTDSISTQVFKEFFHRFRPCWNSEVNSQMHLLPNICGGQFGFVSSHAANNAGFMVFSSVLLRVNWLQWVLLFMTICVGYSRIYLGVHYPFDVLCGWLLGVVLGQIMVFAYSEAKQRIPNIFNSHQKVD